MCQSCWYQPCASAQTWAAQCCSSFSLVCFSGQQHWFYGFLFITAIINMFYCHACHLLDVVDRFSYLSELIFLIQEILIANPSSKGFLPCSDLKRAARKAEIKVLSCSNHCCLTVWRGEEHQRGEGRKAVRAEVSRAPPRPWRTEERGCSEETRMTFSVQEPQLSGSSSGRRLLKAGRAGSEAGAMSGLGAGGKTPRF